MVWGTRLSLASTEGWLDFERPESDLRGSRGISVVRDEAVQLTDWRL